jgi:asparagine synthase (glutamine-hydrolysing)
MSGITGVFYRNGRLSEATCLVRMLDVLWHRGSECQGVVIDGKLGLGQCISFTTPESLHEKLPFINSESGTSITSDARLDNRIELIKALGYYQQQLSTLTDSSLILAAYARWGEDCVDHLLGDFAFAIWDQRKQKLFCARDHFGCKPLIYYLSDNFFAFASEAKALLTLKEIPSQINRTRISDYLIPSTYLEPFDKTSTFYQHLFRLPPATTLTVHQDRVSIREYWSLDANKEIRYKSDDDYAKAFREIFTEAVRCRLRSAGRVSSMLSGGLDSAAIVCVGRDLLAQQQQQLVTYSAVSRNRNTCAESLYINEALHGAGLVAQKIFPDELGKFVSALDAVLHNSDDLFDNVSSDIPLISYAAAKEQGINVVMDGCDGDLVASGNSLYFSDLLRAGKFSTFAREAKAHAEYYSPYYKLVSKTPTWMGFRQFGINPFASIIRDYLPEDAITLIQRMRKRIPRTMRNVCDDSFINIDFAHHINLLERYECMAGKNIAPPINAKECHRRSLLSTIPTVALERYERLAASQAVEPRRPFFDKRLVEFCLAIPDEQKLGNGWTKLILRRGMEGILPPKIQWRGWAATNNMPLFYDHFRSHRYHLLEQILSSDLRLVEEFVDIKAVKKNWREEYKTSSGNRRKYWDIASLYLWLQRNREHKTHQ